MSPSFRWKGTSIIVVVACATALAIALAIFRQIQRDSTDVTAASLTSVAAEATWKARGTGPAHTGGMSVLREWVWRCNSTHLYGHMSMLEALPGGRLAMAWQAAPGHEGESMAGLGRVQGLWYSISLDSGRVWSEPSIAVGGVAPSWGPVLHLDATEGRLWLFYSHSRVEESPGGDVVYRTTQDLAGGSPAWGPPTVIWRSEDLDGFPKVTANRLEVVPGSGDWLLPVWQEGSKQGIGISSVLIGRRDHRIADGRSWEVVGRMDSVAAGWLIEGTLARLPTGGVLQLFRTKDRRVWQSVSVDGGRSWGKPARIEGLRNPNSKIAATAVTDAGGAYIGIVLAYNPSEDIRSPLVLAFSDARGGPWRNFAVLEDEEQVPGRWYAYPTVVQQGAWLRCSYTVYDHLDEGDVIGVVETSSGMRACSGGADICKGTGDIAGGLVKSDKHSSFRQRRLKNRFLGIRVASVPVSMLP